MIAFTIFCFAIAFALCAAGYFALRYLLRRAYPRTVTRRSGYASIPPWPTGEPVTRIIARKGDLIAFTDSNAYVLDRMTGAWVPWSEEVKP